MIEETIQQVRLIQSRIKPAYDRQKKYTDINRRKAKFEVGDKVLLKVSPMKGVHRLVIKGKLSPRYISPYEIIARVRKSAQCVSSFATLKVRSRSFSRHPARIHTARRQPAV